MPNTVVVMARLHGRGARMQNAAMKGSALVSAKVAGVAGVASLHQTLLVISMTAMHMVKPLERVQIANAPVTNNST